MRKVTVLAISALAASNAHALIQIDLFASPAPNVFGSASYNVWWDNARQALREGRSSLGFDQFTRYNNVSGMTRPTFEAAVTPFKSWRGIALNEPEYGQRMHFVYRIYDTSGANVELSRIREIQFSSAWRDGTFDTHGPFDFDGSTNFVYERRIGYIGATQITSGNQPVKEIIGTFGLAYEPDPSWTGTEQERLDQLLAALMDTNTGMARIDAQVGYLLNNEQVYTRSQFVNFYPVPEPATLAALGLGCFALLRRRRK